MLTDHKNDRARQAWLERVLGELEPGLRILDAGAGELRNRTYCTHLNYVSQDFGQYVGSISPGSLDEGYQNSTWDTANIDIVSDITAIPEPDASFDVVVCTEVLEHIPDPTLALDEFVRLLKPGGTLILTAPFASVVHMAPYYFSSGFSKYWYRHHLEMRDMTITELTPNGDWFDLLRQELGRIGSMEKTVGNWSWPLAYGYALLGMAYFRIRGKKTATDFASFGWFCIARKITA